MFEGQELGQAERDARRHHALERRFVGQIQEDGGAREQSGFFKSLLEVCRGIVRNAERDKDDRQRLRLVGDPRLQRDLRGQLVMRESGAGKYRELLSPHHRVHAVDSGDAGLDEILRIRARGGVQRSAMHVHSGFSHRRRQSVSWPAEPIEDAAEHLARDAGMERLTAKPQQELVGMQTGGFAPQLRDDDDPRRW